MKGEYASTPLISEKVCIGRCRPPSKLKMRWTFYSKRPISIQRSVAQHIPAIEQHAVQALLIEELRRLHEGMLARYGLRPSEYATWKALHAPR